jgi:hypothetical protein
VSTLGTSLEPALVEDVARRQAREGFVGQKWFMAHGPGDGPAGLERGIELPHGHGLHGAFT